ncbi:MAG: hypothetical protein KME26_11695 [Oscillatoria princeps RMCB-10]|nr:hypothetical protein [Oscillatoria princeps RMCB-10]
MKRNRCVCALSAFPAGGNSHLFAGNSKRRTADPSDGQEGKMGKAMEEMANSAIQEAFS